MSAVRAIFSLVMVGIFLYFTITSVGRLLDAYEDVKIAQKEYDNAVAEDKAARAEMNNIKANFEVTERNSDGRPISWVCP